MGETTSPQCVGVWVGVITAPSLLLASLRKKMWRSKEKTTTMVCFSVTVKREKRRELKEGKKWAGQSPLFTPPHIWGKPKQIQMLMRKKSLIKTAQTTTAQLPNAKLMHKMRGRISRWKNIKTWRLSLAALKQPEAPSLCFHSKSTRLKDAVTLFSPHLLLHAGKKKKKNNQKTTDYLMFANYLFINSFCVR